MEKKIRILQLGCPAALYGAERWILALIKHLDPLKIESLVGVIEDEIGLEAPLCREAEAMGFDTISINAFGKFNFRAVCKLRSVIKNKKVQILHTHGYKQDIIGFLATRFTDCRIISTPHGWSDEFDLKLRLYEFLNRLVFYFFDHVVPLSVDLFNGLKKLPFLSSKLRLIKNGVDISEIQISNKICTEIDPFKNQGLFVIGYIGQLIHRKGLDILLKAFSRFDNKNLKLVLVGDGPLKGELKDLAEDLGIDGKVIFAGFREDRLDFLRGFDLFVLPSRLEGIPRCLMESMAARIPVVASNIPGCADLIDDGHTGILFPVDDEAALASALSRLVSDENLRASIREQACTVVENQFSAKRMAREYEELFHRICQGESDRLFTEASGGV